MINAKDKIISDVFKLLSQGTVVDQHKLEEENDEEYRCPYNVCGLNGSCKIDNKEIKTDYSITRFQKGSILVDGSVAFNDAKHERHHAIVFMLFESLDKDPVASLAAETKQNNDGLYTERCILLSNNKKGLFYEKSFVTGSSSLIEKVAELDKNIKSYCLLDLLEGNNLNPYIITYEDGHPYVVFRDTRRDGKDYVRHINTKLDEMLGDINQGVALSLKR